MNEKIRLMLDQIKSLEDDIQAELNQQGSRLYYEVRGKHVEFQRVIREQHRKLKQGLIHWFLTVRPQDYLTAPIIYGMVVPLFVFDLCIMFYQYTCFPVYGIARVKRADYFAYDHKNLAYLNIVEKFNCLYCSYGNGLMAYAREILSRTEQYFCPIKHAQTVRGTHARYQYFLDYGDATNVHKKFAEVRQALLAENSKEFIANKGD